jgi:hypothetical protein
VISFGLIYMNVIASRIWLVILSFPSFDRNILIMSGIYLLNIMKHSSHVFFRVKNYVWDQGEYFIMHIDCGVEINIFLPTK